MKTIGLLLVMGWVAACGGSVDPVGGNGAGGEGEGGAEAGGQAPLGGQGGAASGGANEGGAPLGGSSQNGGAGEGGAPSEACALMEQVSIASPTLVDAGGDLVWSPGESATFSVSLTNDAAVDNFNYPGVAVSSSEPGVSGGDNTLFGIFAGQTSELTVSVSADTKLAAGTEIELVFQVTTLSEGCGELASVGLNVTLE